jgi:hypothetical protein
MQYGFGVGILSVIPSGSNPTPLQCGVLQDVSVDMVAGASKQLRGQYKYPVAVAEGEASITGKASFARIFSNLFNQILGGAQTTGMNLASINELGTVPASGPYTVSVTNAATFIENLSVIDATTGLEMTRVASAPATGQYAVTAGVYTFAAADASHVVWLSYSYSSTNGYTVTVSNALMGAGSTFSLVAYNQYESKYMGLKFPAIKAPKLSLAMKMADFTMQNVDFEAYADSTGKVAYLYSSE